MFVDGSVRGRAQMQRMDLKGWLGGREGVGNIG